MLTVRQIEKLWQGKCYSQLCRELLSSRPEGEAVGVGQLTLPAATAALVVIRLDELSQAGVMLCGRLIRTLLRLQEADGGWGDAPTTALCVRALMCNRGDGLAIERGLAYLANLQKPDGLWPAVPIRRLPADPQVSVFVLFELADHAAFRSAVRFDAAMEWFEAHEAALENDEPVARLWNLLRTRRGRSLEPSHPPERRREALLWS